MRLPRPLVALIALCLLMSLAAPATADDDQRLREIDQEIAQKRAQIEAAEDARQSLLEQIADSDDKLRGINATLAELQALLRETRAKFAPVQAAYVTAVARHRNLVVRVNRTQQRLNLQIQALGDRAAGAYVAGPGSWFEVVLTSSSFGDLIAKQELANRVLLYDSDIVDQVANTKARLEDMREEAGEARAEIKIRRDELKRQVDRVANLTAKQAAAQAALEQELATREDALQDVEAAKSTYEAAVRALQAESDRIRGIIQGAAPAGLEARAERSTGRPPERSPPGSVGGSTRSTAPGGSTRASTWAGRAASRSTRPRREPCSTSTGRRATGCSRSWTTATAWPPPTRTSPPPSSPTASTSAVANRSAGWGPPDGPPAATCISRPGSTAARSTRCRT